MIAPLVGPNCRIAISPTMMRLMRARAPPAARDSTPLRARSGLPRRSALDLLAVISTIFVLTDDAIARVAAERAVARDASDRSRSRDAPASGSRRLFRRERERLVVGVLARTKTPMGTRLLARRLCAPSTSGRDPRTARTREACSFAASLSSRCNTISTASATSSESIQKVRARRAGRRGMQAALRAGLRRDRRPARRIALEAADTAFAHSPTAIAAGGAPAAAAEQLDAVAAGRCPPTLAEGGVIRPSILVCACRDGRVAHAQPRSILALEERVRRRPASNR